MQEVQRKVDGLGERGDRLHRENQNALNELSAQTRVLTRVVEDLRNDLNETKKQNDNLMKAIIGLAMVVIVAFVSWVFSTFGSSSRAHAESPTSVQGSP